MKPKGQQIIDNAKRIEQRLANGERVVGIALQYKVSVTCLRMRLEPIIGTPRWKQIVKRGRYLSQKPLTDYAPMASDEEYLKALESHHAGMYEIHFECSDCGHESNREGPCEKCMRGYVRKAERVVV